MSLYPSLEDMVVDKAMQAQNQVINQTITNNAIAAAPSSPYAALSANANKEIYPDLVDFMGLELSREVIQENMPEYLQGNQVALQPAGAYGGLVAPVSGALASPACAQVTHGIREFILCKGADGKVGLRVQAINNGVFICVVVKDSPAAMVGLRFGDQILQLNGTLVAGYSVDKIHKMLKASPSNNISIVVRDRPFERTVTLFKDARGNIGFQFNHGKITSIVKDSSAARNGILTEHNLMEINGQTVVGMKDKEITKVIESADSMVKVTIIPTFIYEHMVKKLSTSYLRGIMDHSVPDF